MLKLVPNSAPDSAQSVLDDFLPRHSAPSGTFILTAASTPPAEAPIVDDIPAGLPLFSARAFCSDLQALWQDARHALRRRIVLPALAGLLPLSLFFAWLISEPPGVARGVTVEGQQVAGLSLAALRRRTRAIATHRATQPLQLALQPAQSNIEWAEPSAAPQRVVRVTPRELAPHDSQLPAEAPFEIERTLSQAYLKGRELDLRQRFFSRLDLWCNGLDVSLKAHIDADRLTRRLRSLQLVKPINATVNLVGGGIRITPDRPGVAVDATRARPMIEKALENGKRECVLPAASKAATITAAMLHGVTTVRAQSEVPVTSHRAAALTNARLASRSVHSVVILPNHILSLNQTIGERTEARGYLPAPTFVRGEVKNEVGGGVCMISSAAFQAGVLGGLTVVERSAHSKPVKYASPGTDAAIYWGAKDLKLRNDTSSPLVLLMRVQGRKVFATIMGPPLNNRVMLITQRKKSPAKRLRVTTYTVVNGQSQTLCESNYKL